MNNYVLEWSCRQNAFHIQEENLAIEKNLNHLLDNNKTDYIVICRGTREQCDHQAKRFRAYLMRREK